MGAAVTRVLGLKDKLTGGSKKKPAAG
jgi:hypothetical protein